MRIARLMLATLIMAGTMLGAAGAGILAHELPELSPVDEVVYVSPEHCVAEPANLNRIAELTTDELATPDGSVQGLPFLESDQPADPSEAEAARGLMQTMLACINANDPARFLSLFTDNFFRYYSGDVAGIIEAAEAEEGGLEPLDDGYAIVYESNVYRLDDGRLIYAVAAAWTEPGPLTETPVATDLIQIAVIEIDDVWMIDELRADRFDDPNQTPDCGDDCAEPAASPVVTGEGYAGWVMSVEAAEANAVLFVWGRDVTGYFEPSDAEIAEAESVLMFALVQDEWGRDTGLLESIEGHWRQYLGYETTDGRLLAVNGFCTTLGIDPAAQIVSVEDGGSCFWYGIYNLDTHKWEHFSVNGVA